MVRCHGTMYNGTILRWSASLLDNLVEWSPWEGVVDDGLRMVDVGLFLVDPMAGGRLAGTFRDGISTREALILGYDQNDLPYFG